MFTEHLERVLTQTPGALGITLMGFDGIPIESHGVEEGVQAAAIELSAIAVQLRGIADGLGMGEVHEVTFTAGELTTVLRPLTAEYFVALTLAPGGSAGKGRYLMRVVAPKLVAALA